MSDEFDPLTADEGLPAQLSHRRILILMCVTIGLGSVAGTAFGTPGFGVGIAVGGLLAFANYLWQQRSTRALFERAAAGERSVLLAGKYILRYVAIGSVVAFFYITGALPVPAVILGLAAFTFAVVVEGLISIFSSSFKKEI